MTTGEKIRKIRKELGLTQKELADALGINQSNISSIENGIRSNIYLDTVRKIKRVFEDKADRFYSSDEILGDEISEKQRSFYIYDYDSHSIDEVFEILLYYKLSNEYNLFKLFCMLNKDGQRVAIERVEELTEIKKYRKSENETSGNE